MNLTIEQKQLLAEEVMGWEERRYHDIVTPLAGFWFVGESGYAIDEESHGEDWREWQPETDPGDAARLLAALPGFEMKRGLYKNDTKWQLVAIGGTEGWHKSDDFCEAICLAALDYAEDKRAAREREAT